MSARAVPSTPPVQSVDAEKCVLGAMILDHHVAHEVAEVVAGPEDFYAESHAAIYDELVRLADERDSGDAVQLVESLRSRGALDAVGGPDYIYELAQSTPSASNARHYALVVAEKARLRRLLDACGEIMHEAAQGVPDGQAGELIDRAERAVFEVADAAARSGSSAAAGLAEQLDAAIEEIDRRHKEGHAVTGLATGLYDLDELTCGLQPGDMVVLAARPSMGKTALALNIAEAIALGGDPKNTDDPRVPVALFSLEMDRKALTERMLASHAGVDLQRLRNGSCSAEDFRELTAACGVLHEAPVYIDDAADLTVTALRSRARRMRRRHNIGAVIVDYLQLLTSPAHSREGRVQEVTAISRGLKALARDLGVPVVCLAQLNRQAEQRHGFRPRMADLRESGAIEQDADVVMLLHREAYYHQGDDEWLAEHEHRVNIAELIVAKQRNGPTGTVELVWDARCARFRNAAHQHHHTGARP